MFSLSINKILSSLTALLVVATFAMPAPTQAADFSVTKNFCSASDGSVNISIPADSDTITVRNTTTGEFEVQNEGLQTDGASGTKSFQNLDDGNYRASITTTSSNSYNDVTFTVDCDDEIDDLSGSCSAEPGNVTVGEEVVWNATPSGGNGDYSYSWSGAADGSDKTVNETYSSPGTKTATVVISSSDGQSITRDCDVDVSEVPKGDFSVTKNFCSASDGSVNISIPADSDTITVRNTTTGEFEVQNEGLQTDGASGTKSFQNLDDGNYRASITTTSSNSYNDVTFTVDCDDEIDDLSGSCSAEPGNVTVGEEVVWNATPSGGNGDYSYSWSGAADGSDKTVNETYSSPGTKTATVVISSSDGQSITRDCDVDVSDQPEPEDFNISFNSKQCVSQTDGAQSGTLKYNTPDGLDSYQLENSAGTVVASDDTGTAASTTVSFADLPDGTYTFSGTKDGETKRLSSRTINCDDDGQPVNPPNACEPTPVETLTVDSGGVDEPNDPDGNEGTDSQTVFADGRDYFVIASGTFNWQDGTSQTSGDIADAEYTSRDGFNSLETGGFEHDLLIDGVGRDDSNDWGDYNPAHEYGQFVEGDGSTVNFSIYDNFHSDNEGSLQVEIYDCGDDDGGGNNNLNGSCSVSDDDLQPNERVTFSSNASGGEGDYTYSWDIEGTNNEQDEQDTSVSFRNSGTYNGTVTIRDEGNSQIQRTCSVTVEDDDDDDDNGGGGGGGGDRLDPRDDDDDDDDGEVRGDRDIDFSVQCMPEDTIYSIGEEVTFEAEIDSDDIDEDDIDDFDWSGNNNIDEDDEIATVSYSTAGIKEIRVEAEHDGDTESDKCYVQIRGEVKGVSLDQVPYTGPAETAKTLAFILSLLLLGLGGGYAILKNYRNEEIPVGIPTEN